MISILEDKNFSCWLTFDIQNKIAPECACRDNFVESDVIKFWLKETCFWKNHPCWSKFKYWLQITFACPFWMMKNLVDVLLSKKFTWECGCMEMWFDDWCMTILADEVSKYLMHVPFGWRNLDSKILMHWHSKPTLGYYILKKLLVHDSLM